MALATSVLTAAFAPSVALRSVRGRPSTSAYPRAAPTYGSPLRRRRSTVDMAASKETCTSAPPRTSNAPKQAQPAESPLQPDHPQPLSLPASLAILNLTTVLWGTQHAVIKLALSDTNPSSLNFLRFLLAATVALPAFPRLPSPQKFLSHPAFRHGLELSTYLFAGYALQSLALLTTSASRSAFLLYLNVKLVPLFARLLYGRRIAPVAWASAGLALVGTGLLTFDGAAPSVGDLFSVLAAGASALFILRTEAASRSSATAGQLNAVTLAGVAALTAVWTGADVGLTALMGGAAPSLGELLPRSGTAVGAVAYLALVTTALCNLLQTVGQRAVPAERAAVIFSMDPVYAAVFAWLLLGESLGPQGIAGAGIIFFATVVAGLGGKGGQEKEGEDFELEAQELGKAEEGQNGNADDEFTVQARARREEA